MVHDVGFPIQIYIRHFEIVQRTKTLLQPESKLEDGDLHDNQQHRLCEQVKQALHSTSPTPDPCGAADHPRRSFRACLCHEVNQATADMIRIPIVATRKCRPIPPEISARRKYPAKARKTPRQNISNEC